MLTTLTRSRRQLRRLRTLDRTTAENQPPGVYGSHSRPPRAAGGNPGPDGTER